MVLFKKEELSLNAGNDPGQKNPICHDDHSHRGKDRASASVVAMKENTLLGKLGERQLVRADSPDLNGPLIRCSIWQLLLL